MFLARNGRSAATLAAADKLSRDRIGKAKGLILFSGPTLTDFPADEFHAWAKMEDILDYADGRLRICPAAVRSALGRRIVPLSSTEVRARLFDAIDQYAAAFAKLPSPRGLSSHVGDSWPVDQAPPMKGRCEGALKAYAARHGASRR